jgi:hypothetical protein
MPAPPPVHTSHNLNVRIPADLLERLRLAAARERNGISAVTRTPTDGSTEAAERARVGTRTIYNEIAANRLRAPEWAGSARTACSLPGWIRGWRRRPHLRRCGNAPQRASQVTLGRPPLGRVKVDAWMVDRAHHYDHLFHGLLGGVMSSRTIE